MTKSTKFILATGILALALGAAGLWRAGASDAIRISEVSHIHGIAIDPQDPSRLFLATHHGLYVATADGTARRVSRTEDDFMGFTPHPTDEALLYASGHPAGGGNLGVIVSSDGGRTWSRIAEGASGPVDFHAMSVSRADPNVVYGHYRGVQASRDGGKSWEIVGAPPADIFDLAASGRDPDTVYAATRDGLVMSKDGGRSWTPAFVLRRPASMVETGPDGTLYAFVVGTGLVKTTEPSLDWAPINNGFGDQILLHLAIDPTNANRLFAVTHKGAILASRDGGRTWEPLT